MAFFSFLLLIPDGVINMYTLTPFTPPATHAAPPVGPAVEAGGDATPSYDAESFLSLWSVLWLVRAGSLACAGTGWEKGRVRRVHSHRRRTGCRGAPRPKRAGVLRPTRRSCPCCGPCVRRWP
jgi:hypothetical protein